MDAPIKQSLDLNVAFPYEGLAIAILDGIKVFRETTDPALRAKADALHLRVMTWIVNALHIPELPA